MKKRTLPVLAVVAALSSAAFVACGEDHTHDYKWDSNADAHWQICECGDKTAEEAHVDVKNNETGADGADELCDACGRNLHVHNYTWHSDGAGHWEECVCGDKHDSVAHTDVKNNADPSVTEPDGKCDVCGHNIHAVTFNVLGHGTAPKAQYIGEGAHATNPGELAADDSWKFKGWYKDEACTVAYDFAAEAVSGATTIYAKWEDDDTAGASKKYAHVLALDTENQKPATLESSVYYKYTSAKSGRYKVELALGASENGTFTVDAADGTYGLDCDAESVTIDLDEGDTVYILYTYKGASTDGITVSPVVGAVLDETLPADRYPSGTYLTADGSVRAEFNHATKHLVSDLGEITVKYLGGKYDMLYFTADEQGHIGTIKPGENGAYLLKLPGADEPVALHIQPSATLSKVSGYYEPAVSGAITGGITKLYIYQSSESDATAVRYLMLNKDGGSAYHFANATYDAVFNKLTCDLFSATLNLDASGDVESVNICIGESENKYSWKATAPAIPPEKLLNEYNVKYEGEDHTIRSHYGEQYFGADGYDGIIVMEYDQVSGKYSIEVNTSDGYIKYAVVFEDNKSTIKLYDADGALIDTLEKSGWAYHELPTTEQSVSLAASDFQDGYYVYQAKQTGWYNISVPNGATVYYPLNQYDLEDRYSPRKARDSVYLTEDDLVGIYMETPAAITVAVAPTSTPVGLSASNPKAPVNGKATLDIAPIVAADPGADPEYQTSYFTYTAPESTYYVVKVTYNGMGTCTTIYVNDEQHNAEWGDVDYEPISVELTAGNTIVIKVIGQEGWEYIEVSVAEDVKVDATEITLEGEPEGNIKTVSATAATGANYYFESTNGADVNVSGSAAFAVLLQNGDVIEAEAGDSGYVAVIPTSEERVYFKLKSATQQNVTFTQTFEKGSAGYPHELSTAQGPATITLGYRTPVYFTLAPGVYSFDSEDTWLFVYLGEEDVNLGSPFEVEADDVFMCQYTGNETSATLTIQELHEIFSDSRIGKYTGSCSIEFAGETYDYEITLTFNKYGIGKYKVNDDSYTIGITATEEPGEFTFRYDDTFDVTFSFTADGLLVTDEDKSASTFVMEKQAATVGTKENPYVVESVDGSVTVNVPISGDDNVIKYYIQLPAGNYSIVDSSMGYDYELKIDAGDYEEDQLNTTGEFRFLVFEGDLLVVINYSNSEDITITVVE